MKIEETHILAYIKGELSSDYTKECDALMLSSSEFHERVKQIKNIYDITDSLNKQKKVDTSNAWNSLSKRIAYNSFRKKVWNFTRTAAAILLPFFALHQLVIHPMLENTPTEMITLTSAPGIVTKAVLPDGSEVWLNAQSELTYPVRFNRNHRTVELSGEAYFKVNSDPKNRFSVETPGDITVSAFGTEFNVNVYPGELLHQVTLTEGNIEVVTASSISRQLGVGQKAVFTQHTGELVVTPTDTYVETAWKNGKMVFRREKLETITHRLSRKFGVIIHLESDELKDYEYTATFTNETLEDILELLEKSAPITYSISKQEQLYNNTFSQRTVTIKSNK